MSEYKDYKLLRFVPQGKYIYLVIDRRVKYSNENSILGTGISVEDAIDNAQSSNQDEDIDSLIVENLITILEVEVKRNGNIDTLIPKYGIKTAETIKDNVKTKNRKSNKRNSESNQSEDQ